MIDSIKDFFANCFTPYGNAFTHAFGFFFFSSFLYLPISLIFDLLDIQYVGEFLPADAFSMLISGMIVFFWASSNFESYTQKSKEKIVNLEEQVRQKEFLFYDIPSILCSKMDLSYEQIAVLYETINTLEESSLDSSSLSIEEVIPSKKRSHSPLLFLSIIILCILLFILASSYYNPSPTTEEYSYSSSDSSESTHNSWDKVVCSLWNASSDDYDRVHIYNQDGDLASYLDFLNVNEKKDVRLPLGEYEVLYYTKSGERRTYSFSVTDYNDGLFVSLP